MTTHAASEAVPTTGVSGGPLSGRTEADPSGASARRFEGGADRTRAFRVAEARPEDARKGIVRLSQSRFDEMGIPVGAIVAIAGSRTTYARAYPALPTECGEAQVLMDGVTRANAGTTVLGEVRLWPVAHRDAKSVVLSPADAHADVAQFDDAEGLAFLRRYLTGIPVSVEDKVSVTLSGSNEASLRVVGTAPSGPVTVTAQTLIQLLRGDAFQDRYPTVTYEDIGGLSEQVRLVREITELPLKYPEAFARLGIEPPKGILLYGPPGTGKTLLARAVATESGVHFIHVNGPEVMSKYYGESEARLREVFDEARRKAPSILFLDELDALAPKRSEVVGDVEKRVVAQLLALMDGLVSRGQVVVIGATNMPSLLDPALRRPGRFDREVFVPVPDMAGRLEILQIHTRGMALAPDVDLAGLASVAHGYVGADIASLCREAGMVALRRIIPDLAPASADRRTSIVGTLRVTMADFEEAARLVRPSTTREFFTEIPDISWRHVGGLDDVKRRLSEAVVEPLRNVGRAAGSGVTASRSVLLYGPSGTGKTLIAKALAREAGVNLISVPGPSLFSRWFGESEKGLRELFRSARQASPCILCIDEVDALASVRAGQGSATERLASQLLMELDALPSVGGPVVVATTNRLDLIDPAFLRPGRFDLIIQLPMPGYRDREEIFRIHLTGKAVAGPLDLGRLARMTSGFTGADIEGVCRRAAQMAVGSSGGLRVGVGAISMAHLTQAVREVRRRKVRKG